MFRSIKNRLILLYTGSTGLILTAMLIIVVIITDQQLYLSKLHTFETNYVSVVNAVQVNNVISNLWLAEMEEKNKLVIHIEENGEPFLYQGSWRVPTQREMLVAEVKEYARRDKINPDSRPVSMKEVQSNIYKLDGSHKEKYLGELFLMPTDLGYRSVIVIQYMAGDSKQANRQKLMIGLLDLAGIIAFYLISRWIVGKTLMPVEESRRRQNEFVAAASHELKSPLAVIRANASALLLEKERAEQFAQGIDQECKRMSGLIEDLLLLASVDSKNWHIKKDIIDIDKLMIETYDTFSPFCKEHGMDLRIELPEELLPGAEGDDLRLRQILAILLDNAVAYSNKGDTLIIRAYTRKNCILIEVEDHGPGIEPDKKKEVFQRFYREDKSRKDKNHYGLGLSIAKELTELHKGSLFIRDTEGGGATITVSLPILHKPGEI